MSRIDYFSSEKMREDLRGKTVRGGAFTAISQASNIGIQLASIPILARLLVPGDFGLVAMATIITGIAGMFVDAGLSMATVQREDITHRQVSNLFWIATGLGTSLALLVALLSPAVAWFYQEPRLVYITIALAGSFILSGLTIQHQALLYRAMQFRALAIIQITSVLLSQGLAIFIAWRFHSYWALVVMPIALALVKLVGTWIACSWRPGLPSRDSGVRPLIAFGANLTGANFINYFARNGDKMMIGWYWNATLLGYYQLAYKLLLFPLQQIDAPLSAVAVPAMSRLKEDPKRYREFFRQGTQLACALQIPIILFSFVMAEECVLFVLGDQWSEVVPIFRAFFPAALMATTAPASRWVYLSWGHTDRLMKAVIVSSLLMMGGFGIGLPYGPLGVAIGFSTIVCLIRIPNILYCFYGTPLRLRDMGAALWRPFIASMIAGLLVAVLKLSIFSEDGSVLLQLLLAGSLFTAVFFTIMIAVPGGFALFKSWIELATHFGNRNRSKLPIRDVS